MTPSIEEIMAYEQGELAEDEIVGFFQELIDSDLVWKLQGHYGRTASSLIDSGHCTPSLQQQAAGRAIWKDAT